MTSPTSLSLYPTGLMVTIFLFLQVQPLQAQQTGVSCSAVTPIDVPRDPSLYWGTWYTIATCTDCTSPENVCSQVGYEPYDATNVDTTNLTYIGSFQDMTPDGPIEQAFGVMSPKDVDGFNPLYRFDLDLGFAIIPSNFWILTTSGDGSEITAIVTMSCGLLSGTDQQLFFLSRKPYLVAPVTFDSLVAQTKRAITNYDEFNITSVVQAQGWCDYALTETTESSGVDVCDCDDIDDYSVPIKTASGFSILNSCILIIVLVMMIQTKRSSDTKKKEGLSESIM